jgi:ribosome recycling factor
MTIPKAAAERKRFTIYPMHEISVKVASIKGEQLLSFTIFELNDVKQVNKAIVQRLPYEGHRRVKVMLTNETTEQQKEYGLTVG